MLSGRGGMKGQRVLTALNRWLVSQGQGFRAAEKGCVTTFTALVLKSRTAHVFHIGDSRLYRWKGGDLEQVTRDHAAQVSAETCYLTRALGLTLTPRTEGIVRFVGTDRVLAARGSTQCATRLGVLAAQSTEVTG